MVYYFLQVSRFAIEVFLVCFAERPHMEKEVIAIRSSRIELHKRLRYFRCALSRHKRGIEPEIGCQHKRAVVIIVITHIVISRRRLRRSTFQCRMRIDYAGGYVESRL